jgi:hypothetical protein
MKPHRTTASLVGRAIAAVGAIVLGVSLFQPAFEESSISFWDAYLRIDFAVLGVAVAMLVLLLVSLFAGAELLLFIVSVVASFVLGFFLLPNLEFQGGGLGWYLAMTGAATALVGATIALVPTLVARAGEPADTTFLPAVPTTPSTAHPAGWYADPSGKTGLRYWDGNSWTERTQ